MHSSWQAMRRVSPHELIRIPCALRFFFGRLAERAVSTLSEKLTTVTTKAFAREELVTEPRRPLEKQHCMKESLAERIALRNTERNSLVPNTIKVSKCRRYLIVEWRQEQTHHNGSNASSGSSIMKGDGLHLPTGTQLAKPPRGPTRLLAELLRAESTSTDVKGSGYLVYGKRGLKITEVVPHGNYAVRLQFSDDHSGGIFPYDFLHWIGENKITVMRSYLQKLKDKRKSRVPPVRRASTANRPAATMQQAVKGCGKSTQH